MLFLFPLAFSYALLYPGLCSFHSLTYHRVSVRYPDGRERFFEVGYVDDTQFFRFDSGDGNAKAKPLTEWGVSEGESFWINETEVLNRTMKAYSDGLDTLCKYYNESKNATRVFQHMYGCDLSTEGGSVNGFNGYSQYGYNGADYIVLNEDLTSWTAADTAAQLTKSKWEKIGEAANRKLYLEGTCKSTLLHLLANGANKTVAPTVFVTLHANIWNNSQVTLRCWALGYYPSELSIIWKGPTLKEGGDYHEAIEGRPSGDGTFQKWAAVDFTTGDEHKYTCVVQHPGVAGNIEARWESHSSSYTAVGITLGIIVFMLIVVMILRSLRARHRDGGRVADPRIGGA